MSPPKVWSRFTTSYNGNELKLRIQELPADKLEDLFEFLFKFFVPEEELHKASKISENSEACSEYKQGFTLTTEKMGYQIDACCVDEDTERLQIVGVSIMALETRDDPCDDLETVKSMIQAEEIKTLLNLSTILHGKCSVLDKYGVNSCYIGRGLAVDTGYRGLGIATELLRVRSLICSERGIPLSSAWMTSVGTQRAAARLGWETVHEAQYKELGEEAGAEFIGGPPSCKLMAVTI